MLVHLHCSQRCWQTLRGCAHAEVYILYHIYGCSEGLMGKILIGTVEVYHAQPGEARWRVMSMSSAHVLFFHASQAWKRMIWVQTSTSPGLARLCYGPHQVQNQSPSHLGQVGVQYAARLPDCPYICKVVLQRAASDAFAASQALGWCLCCQSEVALSTGTLSAADIARTQVWLKVLPCTAYTITCAALMVRVVSALAAALR
jgi:hypothetical protein